MHRLHLPFLSLWAAQGSGLTREDMECFCPLLLSCSPIFTLLVFWDVHLASYRILVPQGLMKLPVSPRYCKESKMG